MTQKIKKTIEFFSYFSFLAICTSFFFITACIPTKKLQQNETLLYEQTIIGSKKIPVENLEQFFRQKPNRKIFYFPAMPYVYAYYMGLKSFPKQKKRYEQQIKDVQASFDLRLIAIKDSTESDLEKKQKLIRKRDKKIKNLQTKINEGNWLMRSVGEKPSIYDSSLTKQTTSQMNLYLKQQGFFDSRVTYTIKIKDKAQKKVVVTYFVKENLPQYIKKLEYNIADTNILKLVLNNTSKSYLQINDIFNETSLSIERDRLFALFKNNGYLDFSKEYIHFSIDTNFIETHHLGIKTIIDNSFKNLQHKIFRISQVNFIADYDKGILHQKQSFYQNVNYIYHGKYYSRKILDKKIKIRSGDLYDNDAAIVTQRALGAVDLFKFVNIRYDTIGTECTANIYVNSYPKYNLSFEAGVSVTQSIPGPFFSTSFSMRNLLRACEIWQFNGRGLVETQTNFTNNVLLRRQAREANFNISLTVPKLLLPTPFELRRILGKYNPQTRIQTGYQLARRIEYSRSNLLSYLKYSLYNNRNTTYSINLYDLNLIITDSISDDFKKALRKITGNDALLQSFRSSAVVSSSAAISYNNNAQGLKKVGTYWQSVLESGGSRLGSLLGQGLLGNQIQRVFKNDSLVFFSFFRASSDLRLTFPTKRGAILAMRLNTGIARPSQSSGLVLPYEKYFFIGGSNSVRAFNARRLGPGSYNQADTLETASPSYQLEQPGEIILEASLELRKKLVSFVEGALFVDAGNTWMLTKDNRKGAQISKYFWREIALGVGAGLRLDFEFLIIRTDVGIKAYEPARPLGQRIVLDNMTWGRLFNGQQSIWHIAIGYPF